MPRFLKLVEVTEPTGPEQAVIDALCEANQINAFIIVDTTDFNFHSPIARNEFLTAMKHQLNQLIDREQSKHEQV